MDDTRLTEIEELARRGGHFGRSDLMRDAVCALVGVVRELRDENRILRLAVSDTISCPHGFPLDHYAEAKRKLHALKADEATVKPGPAQEPELDP